MIPTPLRLMGAPGSPYTRKMLSLLRFRRIPYEFYIGHMGHDETLEVHGVAHLAELPTPRINLMPTFYLPDDDGRLVAMTDSTPLIRRFEAAFPERGVVPPSPAIAFLNELLEDFADEWLTKAMFHYRWTYPADIEKACNVLPLLQNPSVSDAAVAPFQRAIGDRQVERLDVVGSNEITRSVIESSYRRIVELLNAHFSESPFLLGQRPGSCDFAFSGQLTCLVLFDPTPSAVALDISPRLYAWVERIEDLSGLDARNDGWFSAEEIPATLRALLAEVGRGYVPVMLANSEAVTSGAEEVTAIVDGARWIQKPFSYQSKCLQNLRKAYAVLSPPAREELDKILDGTGCKILFQ